jgi:uncharacterized membrane protein YbhN (UPF0104 family)
VTLVVVVIGLYVIVPQLGNFRSSWHLLSHPKLLWLAGAIALTAATYLAAAATYFLLAFRSLRYAELLLMQLAAMFINRLLPAGIGGLGANYTYFRHHHQTDAQAVTMVTVNNVFGLLGHGLLLAVTLLVAGGSARDITLGHTHLASIGKIVGVIVVVLVVIGAAFGRQRLIKFLHSIGRQLLSYRQRPGRLLAALGSSMVLTLCNVLSLYCCAVALGVHLAFAPILLIFTFGVGVGTVAPTPGGLGGFEAGLVGGLVAYHVASSTALAVALLYRLVSYWLALAVGAICFAIAQRRQLFS